MLLQLLHVGRVAVPRCLTVMAVLLATMVASDHANAQSLVFSQIDAFLDDGSHPNTDWGSVDMTLNGVSSMQFLNVSVNGSWQIQNMPVLSDAGAGISQTMTFNFDLGVPNGVDYTGPLSFGFTLASSTGTQPPENLTQPSVGTRVVNLYDGEEAGIGGIGYDPSLPGLGYTGNGFPPSAKIHWNPIPNQECDVNECVPAAVSNSLQYLNARHNMGVDPAELTIEKMKDATGWNDGAPAGWWNRKDQYMQDNRLPFTTTTTTDPNVAMAELADGCDIEIGSPNHRAFVIGMTDLGDGRWAIDVAHDTDQGNAGGTKEERVILNTNSGLLFGAFGFNGVNFRNFVIECPKSGYIPEPSSALLVGIGLAALAMGRARRK